MTNLLFENVEDLSLVAVRESEQSVSYLQLREKIAKRAAGIRKHLGVDAKIAVYLPRSINQMVSMLAIFEAGLTYVPIDVDVAQERVEYIINKADCESIITTQELYNSLDENIKQTTSFLDTVLIDSEGVLENEENNKINNDTDAYIIFTSGTTGNPKGVRISYANLTNLIKSSYKYFQSGKKHETILLNSLSFDFSIWEILIALSSGDSINILDDYVRLDQKKLIEVISEKKIDSLAITPSYMSALINVMDMYKIDIKNIISRIILGAEKVGTRLISDIFEHCGPEVEIYNAYGPTEVTVCSFIKKIRADEMDRYNRLKSVPIGSPFQDVKAMVIKMNDNEAETKGELILYGEAVSDRGYIGASEEENKKFGEIDGERAYHTGDIVSIDNDEYVFIERNDSQCKINGFRVELDEIRNLILSYPMVSDAYVTTYSVSDFTTVIIAFVVGKSGYSEKDLREICESKLNKYMRPNYYVKAKEFPRTNNGKLDVARLIETFKGNYLNPKEMRGNNETFNEIVTEILGIEKIDLNKSFFELGGGSLNAIQFQDRLAKELNCELQVKDDLAVGIVTSGRDYFIDNIDDAIGNFMKTVPIRLSDANNKSFEEICKEVQESVLNGIYHIEDITISSMRNALILEKNQNVFNDIFLFENYPASVPIGMPIAECVFILDNSDKEDEGELLIGGPCVTLGYLNDEEKTNKVFVQKDNVELPGKYYRTGDYVKRYEDGNYIFLHRVDDQVKIRGFRIEISEVEKAIEALNIFKRSAVVAVWNEENCTQKLVAFYVGGKNIDCSK